MRNDMDHRMKAVLEYTNICTGVLFRPAVSASQLFHRRNRCKKKKTIKFSAADPESNPSWVVKRFAEA